jgi:hypothetical protein
LRRRCGGVAWDVKIRGQIASWALFVPVISATPPCIRNRAPGGSSDERLRRNPIGRPLPRRGRGEKLADRETEGLAAELLRAGDQHGFRVGIGVDSLGVRGGGFQAVALRALAGRGDEVVYAGHTRDDDFVAIRFVDHIADAAADRGEQGMELDDGHGGERRWGGSSFVHGSTTAR